MSETAREAQIAEVDAFLAEAKRVQGGLPKWGPSGWRTDLVALWIVEDEHRIARAQLRFTCRRAKDSYPSINLIFRSRPIWRVEIEDPPISHRNPPWAREIGLPSVVRGSHEHAWPDNRSHVARLESDWDIPCRRAIQPQIQRLPQAWAWFAHRVNISLESNQRGFDIPPQRELF